MDEDQKIIYILIRVGAKPVVGYGMYKGEFINISERKLKSVQPGRSASATTSDDKYLSK